MKKFLLAVFTAVILLCVFTIGVSAATHVYNDENGNEIYRYEAVSEKITIVDGGGNVTHNTERLGQKSGGFPKTDANGNALTWYVSAETKDSSGNVTYTVKCLPTLQTEGYDSYAATVDANGNLSYKSPVTNKNVVSVNFPNDKNICKVPCIGGYGSRGSSRILFCYFPNTITAVDNGIFQETPVQYIEFADGAPIKSLEYKFVHAAYFVEYVVNIPKAVTRLWGQSTNNGASFYLTRSLVSVTFEEGSQLSRVDTNVFLGSSLKYITLPDSVTYVGDYAFGSSGLINSPFTTKSRCTEMGGRVFDNCKDIENFIVPSGLTKVAIYGSNDYGIFSNAHVRNLSFGTYSAVTTFLPSFFARAQVDNLILPEGPTHIPNYFFTSAVLTDVKLPQSIETMGHRAFLGTTVQIIRFGANFKHFVSDTTDHFSLMHQTRNLEEVYLPASFYEEDPGTVYKVSYAFAAENSGKIKFFYTGTLEDLTLSMKNFKEKTSNYSDANGKFVNAKQVSYKDYLKNPENYQEDVNYIFYDYSVCDAFYDGNHENDNNPCIVNCSKCNTYGVAEKNPVHNIATVIKYLNYAATGEKIVGCTNEGCKECTTTELPALIISKGYSQDSTSNALVLGLSFDEAAIAVYEEYVGAKISFGLVASSVQDDNSPLNADGSAKSGAVKADLTSSDFTFFQLKITNIDNKDKGFHCAGYLMFGNEIYYVNGKTTAKAAIVVSYNEYTGKQA